MEQEKIQALCNDMTIEEKVGQLLQINGNYFLEDAVLTGPEIEMGFTEEEIKNCGSILNAWGADKIKQIQDKIMEGQPHHIPAIIILDVINGFRTIAPIPLAQGCSFDPELVTQAAKNVAKEAAVSGVQLTFSPMVDLVRDPRWGRVMESTGEDKYLNSQMGAAMVKGYQGEDLKEKYRIGACVKHFAGYGAPEGGREYNAVELSPRTLFEDYLPAYRACVEAEAVSVMTAFHTLDRIPCTANKWLLRDVLRKQMEFDGVLISDYSAILELINHGVAEDKEQAARLALRAGVDIDMMSNCYTSSIKELIRKGELDEQLLDEAVLRVLTLKNKLGLFEHPYKDASVEAEQEILLCEEHKKTARKLTEESFVLLENDGILPLKTKGQKIAFVGPYANKKDLYGVWSMMAQTEDGASLKEVVPAFYPDNQYCFESGCNLEEAGTLLEGLGSSFTPEYSKEEQELALDRAEEAARTADVVVVTIGEHRLQTGEAASRASLTLYEKQLELLDRVHNVNKNVVVVLFNGRPLLLKEIKQKAKAILEVWLPGTEGAEAIADTLFGKANPSGKLTMSFPEAIGQIPVHYDVLSTGRSKDLCTSPTKFCSCYQDVSNKPLYPFGYGLSYTSFSYGNVTLEKKILSRKENESMEARVAITNVGDRMGTEIVQLYVQDVKGSVSRPVKELKGFERISLMPGESKEVSFTITKKMLRFYDLTMDYCSEPGEFRVYIGANSEVKDYVSFQLI